MLIINYYLFYVVFYITFVANIKKFYNEPSHDNIIDTHADD